MVSYQFKPESLWIRSLTLNIKYKSCYVLALMWTPLPWLCICLWYNYCAISGYLNAIVTVTSVHDFTLSVLYTWWLQQWCPIGNMDTVDYHGANNVPWRSSAIALQEIYCILVDHLTRHEVNSIFSIPIPHQIYQFQFQSFQFHSESFFCLIPNTFYHE